MVVPRVSAVEQVLAVKGAVGARHKRELERENVERADEFFGREEDGPFGAHPGPPSDDWAHLAQVSGRKALGNDQELVVRSLRIASCGDRRAVNYDRNQVPVLRRL